MSASTPHGMPLRAGTVDDAPAAAALHAGQISEGFLSILGQPFLTRLYRRVARAPGSFLLVVEDGTTTAGFLAGSTDVPGLYRSFLVRDGATTALACGGRLLRSWRRVMETLRHGTGASSGGGAELLAIAVHPAWRGRGVGGRLVDGFLDEIWRRGEDHAHVVVAAGNGPATGLYERAGFRTAEHFALHEGTESLLMRRSSSPATE